MRKTALTQKKELAIGIYIPAGVATAILTVFITLMLGAYLIMGRTIGLNTMQVITFVAITISTIMGIVAARILQSKHYIRDATAVAAIFSAICFLIGCGLFGGITLDIILNLVASALGILLSNLLRFRKKQIKKRRRI